MIKPVTYVNLSGLAAVDFLAEYDVNIEDFLVVYDDLNLDPGKIRIRKSGGDGGHNGISSLIYHLQNDSFPRLRFGIGNNFNKGEMADFVLSSFDPEDSAQIDTQIDYSVELIEKFISGGLKSMLEYFSINSNKDNSNSDDK